MDKNELVVATIIAIIIFFYSLELTSFSGYTYLGLTMLSIILYFGTEHIIKMLNNGVSIIAIIGFVISMLIIIAILWAGYNIYINKKKLIKNGHNINVDLILYHLPVGQLDQKVFHQHQILANVCGILINLCLIL